MSPQPSDPEALLGLVARELVALDANDADARRGVRENLARLCTALLHTPHRALAERLRSEMDTMDRDPDGSLERLGSLLDEVGTRLEVGSETEPTEPQRAARDQDTIELFAGFIAEGAEGLDQADQILLSADREPATEEQVHALFRVFHTLKGVAGFLDLKDVTELAHATETLLGRIRDGRQKLAREELAVVFDASSLMRKLVEETRTAVDTDLEIGRNPATPQLIRRIEAVTTGSGPDEGRPPHLPPRQVVAASVPESARVDEPQARGPVQEARKQNRIRETVKVDLERIDNVVEMIGELIIVESMIVNSDEVAQVSSLRLRNYFGQLAKISRDLQDVAMRMRTVPVRGVFQKMERLVRDLATKTGKQVRLDISGEATEMDRSMVERIEEPLVHMIRNAVDHAVEPPEERTRAGKPELGTLRLSARHEGGGIIVELSDDGRGLQREAIVDKARRRGLIADADSLTDAEVQALIFLPGFSTAAQVSELSGRGVGMDVVKKGIEAMRGRVTVSSTPGAGTTFKLMLPLTLAIIDGMLVSSGGERYILPSLSIVESLQPDSAMLHAPCNGAELLEVRGESLPLVRLAELLNIDGAHSEAEQARIIVVESAGRKMALLVDEIIAQQQVVIKPLSSGVGDTALLAGAAIMSDGRVGLILNVDRLGEVHGGSASRVFAA